MSAVSNYISNNPYRFLGVTSNSGIKEIQKNLSKLKAYSKMLEWKRGRSTMPLFAKKY